MKVRIWIPILPAAVLVGVLCLTSPILSDAPVEDRAGQLAAEDPLAATPGAKSPIEVEDVASGLQGVFRLQGKIHFPNGSLYTQTVPLQLLRLDPLPSTLVYTTVIAAGGQFDVALPEGLYWLGTEHDLSPFYMPRTHFDLQSDVLGKVITLLNQRESPVGETPPDASLITVSAPDADGFAMVNGAPGRCRRIAPSPWST